MRDSRRIQPCLHTKLKLAIATKPDFISERKEGMEGRRQGREGEERGEGRKGGEEEEGRNGGQLHDDATVISGHGHT